MIILGGAIYYHSRSYRICYNLKREALLHPKKQQTPWKLLLYSNDDKSFNSMMKMSKQCFFELYFKFKVKYVQVVNPQAASHRILDSISVLALSIMYLTTNAEMMMLCPFFGITRSEASKYIWSALELLLLILPDTPSPTLSKFKEYAAAIENIHPTLIGIGLVGFVDGMKLLIHRPKGNARQKLYYNGWIKDHVVNNVL